MAPRGRTRKARNTRMDAAIDAMKPFGFDEKLVRRKVRDLLKEYGGEDGWPFLESDAYKLLIDMLLDGQEEVMLLDGPSRDEAGPSGLVSSPKGSEVADAAMQTDETGDRRQLLPAASDGLGRKEIGLDQDGNKDMVDATGQTILLHDATLQSPPSAISSPLPANSLPSSRRRPCHGWISSDDDDDDFILLTPAVRSTPAKPNQRKRRWDVGPEDA